MLLRQRLDEHQISVRASGDSAGRDHLQAAIFRVTIEPDSYRGEVADHLGTIRIETDEQGTLPAPAGCFRESTAEGSLGRAGEARDQHAGAAVVAATQHGIESFHA